MFESTDELMRTFSMLVTFVVSVSVSPAPDVKTIVSTSAPPSTVSPAVSSAPALKTMLSSPLPAGDRVGSRTAGDRVGIVAARERIVARTAQKRVVAVTARQHVVVGIAVEVVAVEHVAEGSAGQGVVAAAAEDQNEIIGAEPGGERRDRTARIEGHVDGEVAEVELGADVLEASCH